MINHQTWSSAGEFITGLFEKSDWSGARWIGFEDIPDSLLLVPEFMAQVIILEMLPSSEQLFHISEKSSHLIRKYHRHIFL